MLFVSPPGGTMAWLILTFFFFFLSPAIAFLGASLIAQLVKNLPATQEILVRFLGQVDPLEKG